MKPTEWPWRCAGAPWGTVARYMKREGRIISHELTCRYVRADESGKPARHCRHSMKYNRPDCTAKTGNIPGRTSIHDKPEVADGKRFDDWEKDTIVGKNGKGTIPMITERSTNFILMEKLKHDRETAHAAKTAIRLLPPHMGTG